MIRQAGHGREHSDFFVGHYEQNEGIDLYQQNKYSEAEEVLRHAVRVQEQTLGHGHNVTLGSKFWLGLALCRQGKVSEAEEVLRQTVRGQKRTLGKAHEETLRSEHWLGLALCRQGKVSEAEKVLRQTVRCQERTLGKEHKDTLGSKHWLGKVLYKQAKDSEAEEVLQQTVHGQERTLGQDHKGTLATMRLLEKLRLSSCPPLATSTKAQEAVASRLSNLFFKGRDIQAPYTDSEINEISSLLKHSNQRWSKVPRTYVVLRTIGHANLLDELLGADFSDYWFPVTERNLPGCLPPSVKASFVRTQSLVLTKSMDLEKGKEGQHCYYEQGELPPFETKGVLGRGGFGQVEKVLNLISFKEYARKRVPRALAFRGRRKTDIKLFIAEIEILKRLQHRHIVELVGSYTDSKYMALIMSPVAEMDLDAYLTRTTISNYPELRTFFGCLATALEYLHEQKIRHKDIKPGNILVDRGNILFADFGLSFDFADADGSTTMSMVNGLSPRYCAPEVAQHDRRNTMSDIWSLGVVFMEMVVVLKGRTVQDMYEVFRRPGSQQASIRTNLDALPEFATGLEGIGKSLDNCALGWARKMLIADQRLRPTASSLVTYIVDANQEEGSMSFCGICCGFANEDHSDFSED
jgi:TolA-binding protein